MRALGLDSCHTGIAVSSHSAIWLTVKSGGGVLEPLRQEDSLTSLCVTHAHPSEAICSAELAETTVYMQSTKLVSISVVAVMYLRVSVV